MKIRKVFSDSLTWVNDAPSNIIKARLNNFDIPDLSRRIFVWYSIFCVRIFFQLVIRYSKYDTCDMSSFIQPDLNWIKYMVINCTLIEYYFSNRLASTFFLNFFDFFFRWNFIPFLISFENCLSIVSPMKTMLDVKNNSLRIRIQSLIFYC